MRDYNFFSPYIETKKSYKDRTVIYIAAAALIFVLAIGFYGFNAFRIFSMGKEIAGIDSYLSSEATMQGVRLYSETQAKVKVLKDYQVIIEDIHKKIESSDKVNSTLLDHITNTLPQTIDLNVVNVTADGIQLQGTSGSRTAVAEYIHNLKETNAFASVHVANINQGTDKSESYMFTLVCRLGGDSSNEAE